jgi:hypothetical protein
MHQGGQRWRSLFLTAREPADRQSDARCYTTTVNAIVSNAGLALAAAAVPGMLIGAVIATTGSITRRRRLGLIGARLCLGGPGLASIGIGLFLLAFRGPRR